jgi:Tol biopolymer transport system component
VLEISMNASRGRRSAFASLLVAGACLASMATLRGQSITRIDIATDGRHFPGKVSAVDVSDDGTRVVFATKRDGIDPADANGFSDVYLRDLVAGTTTLVSVNSKGEVGNGDSLRPRISADGRFVAFESGAGNLDDSDLSFWKDVFLRDLAVGTTTLVSIPPGGAAADGASEMVAISGDGQRVLFLSRASNLVDGDTNSQPDLFLRDVAAGTTVRVDVAADGTEADERATGGDLSRDGQVVLIASDATNLVPDDTNGREDVFVHDLVAGTVVRASVDSNGDEFENGTGGFISDLRFPSALSPDGLQVAFSTYDADAAGGDDNSAADVFLRDLVAGTTTIQSVDSDGQVSGVYAFGSFATAISSDTRFILMEGTALTLAANEGTPLSDVYVRDRTLGMTTRQSNRPDGVGGNGASQGSRMSADGRFVVFTSSATDLLEPARTAGTCAFLMTRPLRDGSHSNYGPGLAGTNGVPSLTTLAPPLLNQPCSVHLENSSGAWTVGLLLSGTEAADIPTRLGGDLLLVSQWTALLAIPPEGADLQATLLPEERLAAIPLDLQVLELDAGAIHGVSFTAGLELRAGF